MASKGNSGANGTSTQDASQPTEKEMLIEHNESMKDILMETCMKKEKYDSEMWDEFISICNYYDIEISSIYNTTSKGQKIPPALVLTTKDGVHIYLNEEWLRNDNRFKYIATTRPSDRENNTLMKKVIDRHGNTEDIFDVLKRLPASKKEGLNYIHLDEGDSGLSYYAGGGSIHIDSSFLRNERGSNDDIRAVLMHEMAHSYDLNTDFGVSTSYENFERAIRGGLSNSFTMTRILANEDSSSYSWLYSGKEPFNPALPGSSRVGRMKYPTESFAEAMKVTEMNAIYGPAEAHINIPVYKNGRVIGETEVSYDKWAETNPNLSRLADQIYHASSREEAREIMDNFEVI